MRRRWPDRAYVSRIEPYETNEREDAIEEAKSVEVKLGFPARVIRETFHPDSNTTEEVVTYQGTRAKNIADSDSMFGSTPAPAKPGGGGGAPAARASSGGGGRGAQSTARQPSRGNAKQAPQKSTPQQKQKNRKKAGNAIVKIITGFAMSLIIAVIGSFAIAIILLQMLEAGMIPLRNRNPIVFGTFILLFFGTGFMYLNKHFNLMGALKKQPQAKRGPAPKTVPAAKAGAAKKAPAGGSNLADADLDEMRARIGGDDDDVEAPELDSDGFDSGENADKSKDKKKSEKDKAKKDKEKEKKEKAAKKEEERKKKEAEKKAKEEEAKKKKDSEKKASPADVVKPDFLRFLTDAVSSIQSDHPQLNTFSKFGMNLYMCGSCSTICTTRGVPDNDMHGLLKEGLVLIGTNAERAQSFCNDIPTYGSNPRYANMIQAGGSAMTNFLGGQGNANDGLSGLLTEWNLPEKRSAVPTVFRAPRRIRCLPEYDG